MLDMGFVHAIRAIVRKLPAKRHSLFFSATMPGAISDLAKSMLHEPVTVAVTPVSKTADRVEQRVILVEKQGKSALLAELLTTEQVDRALVFARTKHGADKVVRALAKVGHTAEAIHGNKSQNQRDRVLAAFRDGTVRTLVATDIAARGIDVTGVSHVFNFDLPNVPESYVHRIGRTARAGREGIAISFCDGEERAYLRSIEKLIKMQIPLVDRRPQSGTAPAPLPADPAPAARPHGAGRPAGGGRGRGPRPAGEGQEGRGQQGRGPGPRAERSEPRKADGRKGEGRNGQRRDEPRGGGKPASGQGNGIGAVGFMRGAPARGGKPDAGSRGPR